MLNEHINQSVKEGDDYLMSNKVNKFILPDGTEVGLIGKSGITVKNMQNTDKDVETTEAPTVSTQTQQPVSTWTDQENKIVQSWEIKPAQPDPSAALQEIQTQAILEQIKASDDKTLGIQCMALFPVYEQNKQHEVGEVATHPETGYPKECIQTYDGTVQQDWTIDTPSLWKPWHSRKPEYALPWEQPTGAHDMYKAGEYMIWTDGTVKKCIQDTNFSPDEYPGAWEDA